MEIAAILIPGFQRTNKNSRVATPIKKIETQINRDSRKPTKVGTKQSEL